MRKCIKCYKDINENLEYCPKCGQRQFFGDDLSALYGSPRGKFKMKKSKSKPIFSAAEIYTATQDKGFMGSLIARLFSE